MIGLGESIPAGIVLLVLLAFAGLAVRSRSGVLRRLFIPASLVGGAIGLAAGPEVAGRLTGTEGLWTEGVLEVWSALPTLLITVVFAALFLGSRIPGPRRIWRSAGPHVAIGQAVAWGQYSVGLLVALLVLGPLFAMPAASGALIEIGFVGGHGTAAGMAPAFDAADFPEGRDLALGLATVGVVSGVIIGVVFVNWAVRTGRADPGLVNPDEPAASSSPDERDEAEATFAARALLPALAGIAGAAALGWLVLTGLQAVEGALWSDRLEILAHMPLFPFAMLGGIAVQLALMRARRTHVLDRRAVGAVGALALDLLIVSAIATLSLAAIGADIVPFIILGAVGIGWSLLVLVILAPRLLPDWWVPRAAAELGQALGMVAAGLMLLRVADPAGRSPVMGAFGYKQLFFEPVLGGGLFTAASVTLIAAIGGWPILAAVAGLTTVWLAVGIWLFRPGRHAA
jgi:glutamate:Na+ symporter, ESS family